MAFQLEFELRHDDGTVEKLSQNLSDSKFTGELYQSFLDVYCQQNTVELHLIRIVETTVVSKFPDSLSPFTVDRMEFDDVEPEHLFPKADFAQRFWE